MPLTDKTIHEYEQARNWASWVFDEVNGDFWSFEYQQALKRYDAAVAQWNKECQGCLT